MSRTLSLQVSAFLALVCPGCMQPPSLRPGAWPAADALFRNDPRWLGADAALSVRLGKDRILWLFGDTFVATSDRNLRTESRMVRNSIGIQTGADPTRAAITMHWRPGPGSFFPEEGECWFWPGHGARLHDRGPLVLFLMRIRATPGQGLGFAGAGWRIALIPDPDQDPSTWNAKLLTPEPTTFDAVVGTAVVDTGQHLVAVAIAESGVHAGYLARFAKTDLLQGRAQDPEWWCEGRWVLQSSMRGRPTVVLPDAGAECSLHRDEERRRFLHVSSRGFGATTIVLRESPSITGPWSTPIQIFTPPESLSGRPFVYAAKAHPELAAGDRALAITYAANSFEFGDLLTPAGQERLYWPRFVRVLLPAPGTGSARH